MHEKRGDSGPGSAAGDSPPSSSGPYFINRIQKRTAPQNPLRLSIERKAKKNKEIYLKNQIQIKGGLDSQRKARNDSSTQNIYENYQPSPFNFSRKGSASSGNNQIRPNAESNMSMKNKDKDAYFPKIKREGSEASVSKTALLREAQKNPSLQGTPGPVEMSSRISQNVNVHANSLKKPVNEHFDSLTEQRSIVNSIGSRPSPRNYLN